MKITVKTGQGGLLSSASTEVSVKCEWSEQSDASDLVRSVLTSLGIRAVEIEESKGDDVVSDDDPKGEDPRNESFYSTLTLTHNESGWDATFSSMLTAMAEILRDGSCGAEVTYWDELRSKRVTAEGMWISRNEQAGTIVFQPNGEEPITLSDLDHLISISI